MCSISEISNSERLFDFALSIIQNAQANEITLRLFGGLAIWYYCKSYRKKFSILDRHFKDIDLVCYKSQINHVYKILIDNFSFMEVKEITKFFGKYRRKFVTKDSSLSLDLSIDNLLFCHKIILKGRLELTFPALNISDLLLSKLQIVNATKKDLLDIVVLFSEKNFGDAIAEEINDNYISYLCSKDWGLWKTTTGNLKRILSLPNSKFEPILKLDNVKSKIEFLLNKIIFHKKNLKWHIRNLFGSKIKWYNDVE